MDKQSITTIVLHELERVDEDQLAEEERAGRLHPNHHEEQLPQEDEDEESDEERGRAWAAEDARAELDTRDDIFFGAGEVVVGRWVAFD